MGGEAARGGRQAHRDDELTRFERVVLVRHRAGQTVKRLHRDLAPAMPAFDLRDRVESRQRHAEIGRVGRDTVVAPAEHRVKTVVATAGIAARSGRTFVAGAGRVVEIAATGPLQQIAAEGGRIAQLGGSAGEQRLRNGGITAREIRVMREVGVARQRADTHIAIVQALDAVESGQARNVDEPRRAHDPALHQIQKVGAGGEIGGAGRGRGRNRIGHV